MIALQASLSMGSSRQDTGVGCHFLLQGIFLTQESNPDLLHCRQILYLLSYEGSPWYQSRFQRTGCRARRVGSRSRLPKCLGLFIALSGLQHLSERWVNEHHLPRLSSYDKRRSEVPLVHARMHTRAYTHTHTHASPEESTFALTNLFLCPEQLPVPAAFCLSEKSFAQYSSSELLSSC